MILNQIFNQKQVKMKRWEDPSNQKNTHGPPFFLKVTHWLHETFISKIIYYHFGMG
jgi:hypothetical protein